jgi:hypothetical protein
VHPVAALINIAVVTAVTNGPSDWVGSLQLLYGVFILYGAFILLYASAMQRTPPGVWERFSMLKMYFPLRDKLVLMETVSQAGSILSQAQFPKNPLAKLGRNLSCMPGPRCRCPLDLHQQRRKRAAAGASILLSGSYLEAKRNCNATLVVLVLLADGPVRCHGSSLSL